MTDNPEGSRDTRFLILEVLVPVLAFGSTVTGIALWEMTGLRFEIQYAAAGGFLASCLLAYLAWHRPRKDIVSLTTPLYGFLFLVTAIDYYSGVLLQLFYAVGLTILVIRLHYRFQCGRPGQFQVRILLPACSGIMLSPPAIPLPGSTRSPAAVLRWPS